MKTKQSGAGGLSFMASVGYCPREPSYQLNLWVQRGYLGSKIRILWREVPKEKGGEAVEWVGAAF